MKPSNNVILNFLVFFSTVILCIGCPNQDDIFKNADKPEVSSPNSDGTVPITNTAYTAAGRTAIAALSGSMTTGTSATMNSTTYTNIVSNMSDTYLPIAADTLVYYYKTNLGNYGKMIIRNIIETDPVLYLPSVCPPLMITYETYASDGSILYSGKDAVIRQTWLCDLDSSTPETVSGTVSDFQWMIITSTERGIQSNNGAVFYLAP